MSDTRTRGAAITAAAVLALAGTGAAVAVTAGSAHAESTPQHPATQSSAGTTHRAAARSALAQLAQETKLLKAEADALQKEITAAKAAPAGGWTAGSARSGGGSGDHGNPAPAGAPAQQQPQQAPQQAPQQQAPQQPAPQPAPQQQAPQNPAPTTHTTTGASGSTSTSTSGSTKTSTGDDSKSGGHDD